jgi:plastocyanin
VGFTWSPRDPVAGQEVTFTSTSTTTGNNSIQQELWDLNGDGQFGDQSGHSVSKTFSAPGNHVVRLRVVDKHGAEHNHVHGETVVVQPFVNRPPVASFVSFPSAPRPGQPVTFYSTSTDADSAISAQRWDLDGNGSYGDVIGPTASRSFALAGTYTIGLQVEDTAGAVDVSKISLDVSEANTTASWAALQPLFPFPVVRFSGTISNDGIRVHRLTVDAPFGARTAVRCKGPGCPFRWRRYAHRAPSRKIVRVTRLNRRFLRRGASVQVFVTREGLIGRYTRFRIRGGKPPDRVDRCLVSISTRPVSCPAA